MRIYSDNEIMATSNFDVYVQHKEALPCNITQTIHSFNTLTDLQVSDSSCSHPWKVVIRAQLPGQQLTSTLGFVCSLSFWWLHVTCFGMYNRQNVYIVGVLDENVCSQYWPVEQKLFALCHIAYWPRKFIVVLQTVHKEALSLEDMVNFDGF